MTNLSTAADDLSAAMGAVSKADLLQRPLVAPLALVDTEEIFQRLSALPHLVFFDSAQKHHERGRYSYLAVDPFQTLSVPVGTLGTLDQLRQSLSPWRALQVEGLPPWQGGAAGVIGYEIGRSLEQLPKPQWDEFKLPALSVGIYDLAVVVDHQENKAWALSHGLPEIKPARRKQRATERMQWLLSYLEENVERPPVERTSSTSPKPRLTKEDLAPCFEERGLLSNFSREGYLAALGKVIGHLRAGDAFQVNLSQRLLLPAPMNLIDHYLKLRRRNAAPFGGYFDAGRWQILSASPERFLRLEQGLVETRPIKGTSPRGTTPDEDSRLGELLTRSEKDRAENVMIVDLMRNDLSRVCTDESVRVPTLFGLEKYAHVQHLVSVVKGKLREESDAVDLLAATLPGGSITGAPKVSAQQIIAQLEPTARGAYCGSLFCLGFADERNQQTMDSSILIRTLTCADGWMQAQVGGGVTIASDPEQEYEETWAKAAGLVDADEAEGTVADEVRGSRS